MPHKIANNINIRSLYLIFIFGVVTKNKNIKIAVHSIPVLEIVRTKLIPKIINGIIYLFCPYFIIKNIFEIIEIYKNIANWFLWAKKLFEPAYFSVTFVPNKDNISWLYIIIFAIHATTPKPNYSLKKNIYVLLVYFYIK